MQWNGNWAAIAPLEKFGDDSFSSLHQTSVKGQKSAQLHGSLVFHQNSKHKDGATSFIEFAIQDKYLAHFLTA